MVHRMPWVLIIGAIVALVVVMVGCGTAIALIGRNSANQTNTTGIVPLLPSPSPAGSPTAPTTPTPVSTSATTTSNSSESFTLPAGWTVSSHDSQTITITNPNGDGSVTIASGSSNPPQTAQQNKDTIDKFFASQYPDTKNCPNTKTSTSALAGASGIFWQLCFTLTAGGQSVQAGAPLFAGANSSGSIYYLVILLTSHTNMDNFITEAAPILQSIQWKLT